MIEIAVVTLLAAADLSVLVERCGTGVTAEELRRIATLELARAPSGVELNASVECLGAMGRLSVDDPLTHKTLSRRVDLSKVPQSGRARTLALALVELVEASWSELLLPEASDEPGARAGPSDDPQTRSLRAALTEAVRRPAVPSMPFRVEVLGGGRRFPEMALWLWGGGARVSWRPGWIGLGLEARAERGELTVELGYLTVDTVGGSLFGLVGLTHRWLLLEGGAGVRVGSARVTGTPNDPALASGGSQAGAWAGPMLFGQVGAQWDRLVVLLGLEGGLVLLGVRGRIDGAGGIGVLGPNFQISASWGLRL